MGMFDRLFGRDREKTGDTLPEFPSDLVRGRRHVRFFKKKQPGSTERKPGTGGPIISALLLEGETFPVGAFLEQAAKTRMAGKPVSGINRGNGDVFSFDVGDEFL